MLAFGFRVGDLRTVDGRSAPRRADKRAGSFELTKTARRTRHRTETGRFFEGDLAKRTIVVALNSASSPASKVSTTGDEGLLGRCWTGFATIHRSRFRNWRDSRWQQCE